MRSWRQTWRARDITSIRSNLQVPESKADMQKCGQASPDDADALALTFAQPVEPAEEGDEEEEFGRYSGSRARDGCDDATWRVHGQSVAAMVEVAWMVERTASGRGIP